MPGSTHVVADRRSIAVALSAHAALRVQQRGMSSVVIDCLLRYGHYSHDHLGCEVVTVDTSTLRQIARSESAEALRLVSEARSVYAVVAHGHVVTVGYRYRKVLRDRSLVDARKGRGRKPLRFDRQQVRGSALPYGCVVH